MTYRERERETVRRLRRELEQRHLERNAPTAAPALEWTEHPSEEEAEVLYELTCL